MIIEHDLPFTITQPLVELCKTVASYKTAVSKLSVSNQHASNMKTLGIAKYFKGLFSVQFNQLLEHFIVVDLSDL